MPEKHEAFIVTCGMIFLSIAYDSLLPWHLLGGRAQDNLPDAITIQFWALQQ